jgi:antitoxin FitA
MIQVRNVPDGVHRTLKARAAAAGMTLSDYVKRDLELAASRPSLEELDCRLAELGPSGLRTTTVLAALREVREG